jgi:hypothetical protein
MFFALSKFLAASRSTCADGYEAEQLFRSLPKGEGLRALWEWAAHKVGNAEWFGDANSTLDATVRPSAPIASRGFAGKLFQRTAAGASEMIA